VSNERLEELRAQAKELGVKHHHNAGEVKIQEALDAFLADSAREELASGYKHPVNKEMIDPETGKIVPMTSEQYRTKYLPERKKQLNRLVRCRITCMNPAKREWEGEIISVGSAKHGTFKKYIPFDGREWHIPKVIFDEIKERQCTVFHTITDSRGQKVRKGRLIDEFAVEVLPPLTPKELDQLKKEQALANNQG
jgi:hypothetical protein